MPTTGSSRGSATVTTRIQANSFAELMEHEKEIVARIGQKPNGGQLFLIHPFQLLKDIGVDLSEKAIAEIKQREPQLCGLSDVPYRALKNSNSKQNVTFHVRGLFNRGEK
ncbi:MAG: hypothetical protein HQL63_08735 [Magnetococcales bacterium]|nr:hypothetical protein [Magnetococcales bacterium]MBF0322209.1 hypothetical protein [Magnetococcales bacterium]